MRYPAHTTLVLTSLIVVACGDPTGTSLSPDGAPAAARASSTLTHVTTTIHDRDGGGSLLLTRSDQYNGSGQATYTSVNKVSSTITAEGAWQLVLQNQTVRKLYLVLASQGIPAPDGYYSADVVATSKCFDSQNNPVSILSMAAGASNGNCGFSVDFSHDRKKYKLVMSPNFPGTGRATVTCTGAASGSCTGWTITPNQDVANAGVANLYRHARDGSLVFEGAYRNSYSVTATR